MDCGGINIGLIDSNYVLVSYEGCYVILMFPGEVTKKFDFQKDTISTDVISEIRGKNNAVIKL